MQFFHFPAEYLWHRVLKPYAIKSVRLVTLARCPPHSHADISRPGRAKTVPMDFSPRAPAQTCVFSQNL